MSWSDRDVDNHYRSMWSEDPMNPENTCPICGKPIEDDHWYCRDCKEFVIEQIRDMLSLSETNDHYVLKEAVEDLWGIAFGEEKDYEKVCFGLKKDPATGEMKCDVLKAECAREVGDDCGTLKCPFWKPDADFIRIGDELKRR